MVSDAFWVVVAIVDCAKLVDGVIIEVDVVGSIAESTKLIYII